MATTTTVPLTVTPEAAARVEELGLRREFEQLLDLTRRVVPNLQAIDVTLEFHPETDVEPAVVLWTCRPDTGTVDLTPENQWDRWVIDNFTPDVGRHFVMLPVFGTPQHEW